MAITAPYPPGASNLSSVEFSGRHLHPRCGIRNYRRISRRLRTNAALLSPFANTAIFRFLQIGKRFDLLAARADQQHHVMLEHGERAGAGRDLGVGAQHRQIGLPVLEFGQRPGVIAIGA